MAVKTRSQIEQLIRDATIAISGYPAKSVRFNFAPAGQPSFKQEDDVIFITINYLDGAITRQQDVTYKPNTNLEVVQETKYTRLIEVMWSVYGPNCFDTADALKIGILNRANRKGLSQAEIYPVTDIAAPRRAPYTMGGIWWERVDLTVYFNAYTVRELDVPLILSADIKIYDDHGLRRTVIVEEP